MESFVFLIKTTLEKRVVDAVGNLVFKLTNILDSKLSHHVVRWNNSLLRCHVGDCDECKLLQLGFFEWKVCSRILLISGDSLIGKQIQRLEVLVGGSEL